MDHTYALALNQAIRLLSLRHRARAAQLLAPLGLHVGQEALLLELDRTGPRIQAQLSEALGCEPPSVTLMTRKLEASGHIRRKPAPADRRASIVELTDSGRALADRIKSLWCDLAEETVAGLPPETVAEPGPVVGRAGRPADLGERGQHEQRDRSDDVHGREPTETRELRRRPSRTAAPSGAGTASRRRGGGRPPGSTPPRRWRDARRARPCRRSRCPSVPCRHRR